MRTQQLAGLPVGTLVTTATPPSSLASRPCMTHLKASFTWTTSSLLSVRHLSLRDEPGQEPPIPGFLHQKHLYLTSFFTWSQQECCRGRRNPGETLRLSEEAQTQTDLSDPQLSGQRHGQHQAVKLVAFRPDGCCYLPTDRKKPPSAWREPVTVGLSLARTHTRTFVAWATSQNSCRTPRQATHTRDSAPAAASPGASGSSGSCSLARLLGGSGWTSGPEAPGEPRPSEGPGEPWTGASSKARSSRSVSCV